MFFKRIQFDLNKYANKRLNVIYGPASHVKYISIALFLKCKYCTKNALKV